MKFFLWISFIVFFLKELLLSSISVARAALFPKKNVQPGFIKIPLDLKQDRSLVLLANVITLTPGTLTIDIEEDKSALYVHALFVKVEEIEEFRTSIKEGFEAKIKRLWES